MSLGMLCVVTCHNVSYIQVGGSRGGMLESDVAALLKKIPVELGAAKKRVSLLLTGVRPAAHWVLKNPVLPGVESI